jgi:hypothetical protein
MLFSVNTVRGFFCTRASAELSENKYPEKDYEIKQECDF